MIVIVIIFITIVNCPSSPWSLLLVTWARLADDDFDNIYDDFHIDFYNDDDDFDDDHDVIQLSSPWSLQ